MSEAGKAVALVAEIATPTIDMPVKKADGTIVKVPVAQLSIMHWRDIKKDVGTDMWSILLDLYAKAEEMTDEDKATAGRSLMKQIDHSLQLAMFSQGLKAWDPEITVKQTDHIISYGVEDQGEIMRGIFFMLQGTSVEDVEVEKAKDDSGNASGVEQPKADEADTTSVDEHLAGELSLSSSDAGTDSAPGTLTG